MIAETVGAVSVAVWIYLLVGRGGFWRARTEAPPAWKPSAPLPKIAVIVPARNESGLVSKAITSLLRQEYRGEIHVFLVDDHSTDETQQEAMEAAKHENSRERLTVVPAGPLPPGWTGKLWALSEGLKAAACLEPHYFLFTDADIVHSTDNVYGLVARAETGLFDLVSLMVKLRCRSFPERALIPAFVFFFLMLYPPLWIADPKRRTAGAAGGCILLRPSALTRIGGLAAIRGEIIDDCSLARAVKGEDGGRIWMGLATGTESIRSYNGFGEIWRMIARTAFTQLKHSVFLLTSTLAGMSIIYLFPVVLAFTSRFAISTLGLTGWLLMMIAILPTLRLYNRWPVWAPFLPLVALFYLGATVHSAVLFWRGEGGLWKGRRQDRKII